MPGHVTIEDTIRVDEPSYLKHPALLVCRADKVIEVYAVDKNGLEHPVGRLDHHIGVDEEKVRILVRAIRQRVKERPFSHVALAWLSALSYQGMLKRWEDPA
jgi:hypothetical protein